MDGDRLDLTALDPTADRARSERLVARIMERAAPELRRRAARDGLFGALADWAWPALSAAAVLAVISGAALALTRQQVSADDGIMTVVEALQLAEPMSLWISENRTPTTSDLIFALDGGENR